MNFLKLFGLRRLFVLKPGDPYYQAAEFGRIVSDLSTLPHQQIGMDRNSSETSDLVQIAGHGLCLP